MDSGDLAGEMTFEVAQMMMILEKNFHEISEQKFFELERNKAKIFLLKKLGKNETKKLEKRWGADNAKFNLLKKLVNF